MVWYIHQDANATLKQIIWYRHQDANATGRLKLVQVSDKIQLKANNVNVILQL